MKPLVAFVTGSPADWGLLQEVLKACVHDVEPLLFDIGGHSYKFSHASVTKYTVHAAANQRSKYALAELTSQASEGVFRILQRAGWTRSLEHVVVLGDRAEMLAATSVLRCAFPSLPIHHLYAGDRSGCVDDYLRHAISMLATHLYCVSRDAFDRCMDISRVNPRVRGVFHTLPIEAIPNDALVPSTRYAVARFHPETLHRENMKDWVQECARRASSEAITLYVFPPNKDDGYKDIEDVVNFEIKRRRGLVCWCDLMPRPQYLGFLKNAAWIAGNSSSFVLEAPKLNPNVTVYGKRQENRSEPTLKSGQTMTECLKTQLTDDPSRTN